MAKKLRSAELNPGPGFRIQQEFERLSVPVMQELSQFEVPDISDLLNRLYAIDPEIRCLSGRYRLCGPACTVKVFPGDNLMVHKALDIAKPGDIIVAASETAEFWLIEVTDTGPGLPPKAQEHLFTPFQGGVRKGGSGLGMAISEELVRGHGGSLGMVSTSDKGTVFCIKLPKGDLTLSK
jgi:hypothetical protein